MKIRIWGCRGSIAAPSPTTLRYGGHTTCVEVRSKSGQVVILDAGSGLRNLGQRLLQENYAGEIHLMLTHAHWDHVCGFPFFEPAYHPEHTLNICGGPIPVHYLKSNLRRQMEAPYFPVDFALLKAKIQFGCDCSQLNCSQGFNGRQGDLECSSVRLNHPNGGYGFKFTEDGRSLVFIPDNELRFQHEGGLARQDYAAFCRGADLLLHDAQYTEEEYRRRQGWGHCTISDAVELARQSGVGRLGLFHHDPDRTDDELDQLLAAAREEIKRDGNSLDCFACAEGMELEL